MPPTLLDSQFATLEEPDADEPAIRVESVRPRDASPTIVMQDWASTA